MNTYTTVSVTSTNKALGRSWRQVTNTRTVFSGCCGNTSWRTNKLFSGTWKYFAPNLQIDSSFNCHHLLIKLHTCRGKKKCAKWFCRCNSRRLLWNQLLLACLRTTQRFCYDSHIMNPVVPLYRTLSVERACVRKRVLENAQPHLVLAASLQNMFAVQQLPLGHTL